MILLSIIQITFSSWIFGSFLESKYPSYRYVFNEFDVDENYLYDDAFMAFVLKYQDKMERFYERSLKRGKEILPTLQGILLKDGVSDLFIYLSMVESGFVTDAVSPKKAVGLWQFMPATAKQYNLTVCKSYDERCDTVSATSAAIDYLNKLHKQFGKWYLAAMAYNCGEGCVQNAIKQAGTDDLTILTDSRFKYLPKETREYIKKILLVAMIGESRAIDFNAPVENNTDAYIQVEVRGGTSLQSIAKLLNMDEKKLFTLNQSLKNGTVPTDRTYYKITIPIDKVYAFYLRYDTFERKQTYRSHMITHRVKMGDSLEKISKLYDAKIDEIKEANHLEDPFLVLDTLLVIPVNQKIFTQMSQ